MPSRKTIQPDKGTITLAFPFREGIMVGVDSRISRKQSIVSDKRQKFFQMSSNIFCTTMGRVHIWENMGIYVQQEVKNEERLHNAPATVSYAAQMALEHLEYEYGDCEFTDNEEDLIFGTIIAGWHKTTGFELYSVNLDGNRAWKTKCKSSIILGTGAVYAKHAMDSFNNIYNMSCEDAADVALNILFIATIYDKWCGGTLHVYHVHENGYHEKRSLDALEVCSHYYNLYQLHTYEPTTFFLLYSARYQPIVGDDLINLGFDSNRSDEGLLAAHLVAEKRGFNIHRLVFGSENEASRAYEAITRAEPKGASRFPRLQNLVLCELAVKGKRVPVYVQRSSRELSQSICELPRTLRLPSCFGCA